MPTVRQLPSGKFQSQVRLSGHKTQSKSFNSKEEALEWGKHIESNLLNEANAIQELLLSSTVNAVGHEHLVTLKRSTAEVYANRLKPLVKFFKEIPVYDIEQKHLYQYSTYRLNEASTSTCRAELQLLSRILKHARIYRNLDNKNEPFKDFKYPEAGEPRKRTLTTKEYQTILSYISETMKPIVALAYETGMRRSEILSITKDSIDYDRRVLFLSHTKNGESREVPLSTTAISILKCHERSVDNKFFSVHKASVTKAFKRCCLRLGIKDACFHTLRHTAITRLAKKGTSPHQLMAFSGHKDTRMLTRYTHVQATDILHLLD